MRLTRLSLTDFRNYRTAALELPSGVSVFVGANAQGKTNLLEAIYLLGTYKSFKTSHNRDLIRMGAGQAVIAGTVDGGGISRDLEVTLTPTGRRARVNRKPVRRLEDFFGACPVILFAPEDLSLVKGPPALRRRFLDRAIFTGWPGYLPALQAYLGAVQQKQALLRAAPHMGLAADATREAWDAALVRHGVEVIRRRARLVAELAPFLASAYRGLAGAAAGEATVTYRPGARIDPAAPEGELAAALAAAVEAAAPEERRRGVVLVGPHRDDLLLALDGRDLRLYGSQGEQRSFVVALKLAELALLSERLGTAPLFLLDDVASELDAARRRGLVESLAAAGAQVFLTTTELDPEISSQLRDILVFSVSGGTVVPSPGPMPAVGA
ncbi:MAG TPA: DNA replication/repair protein RecF [Thermodesulfobacteriota bacterium]